MSDTSPLIDLRAILKLLPHRYPFLLVDRVNELEVGKRIVALKNVTINEPFFVGHFDGYPVMPGVLIIEGLAQTAGALCVASLGEDYRAELVYFMGIDNAKFRKPVLLYSIGKDSTVLLHLARKAFWPQKPPFPLEGRECGHHRG